MVIAIIQNINSVINICGMSERSKLCLDKYCYYKGIDVLAIQESFTSDPSNTTLSSMIFTEDMNESRNRGALLHVNNKKLNILPLKELSKCLKILILPGGS